MPDYDHFLSDQERICYLIEGCALKIWRIWIFKARRTFGSTCQILFQKNAVQVGEK